MCSGTYDKLLIAGDFNTEETKTVLEEFLNGNNLQCIVKCKTCLRTLKIIDASIFSSLIFHVAFKIRLQFAQGYRTFIIWLLPIQGNIDILLVKQN